MKLLCLIGIHKDEFKTEIVYKKKLVESGNSWWKCKRCGRVTEKSGYTSFGPIDLTIK
jgi:ribosomal protein L37AE/L43A